MAAEHSELSIIRKTYDLILWYVPHINHLPRSHRFALGQRMVDNLYDLLEGLLEARYASTKVEVLKRAKAKLDGLRYQTRLLKDFELVNLQRYEFAAEHLHTIGGELGGWLRSTQAGGRR